MLALAMAQRGLLFGHRAAHIHQGEKTAMKDTLLDQQAMDKPHSTMGTLLAPLFTWRGRDVYPVFGAEGEDDGDGGSDSESDSEDEDDTGTGEDKGGSETVSREDFEKLRAQLSQADKRRDEAEKRLKKIDDAQKDELTKATERAEELEKTVANQNKELASMRLQNAFLAADTGITWHDPADALDIAERRGYLTEVVGEDGKVDQAKLTSKLKELAKNKPNLVKTDGSKEEAPKNPTGQKVGSRGTSGKKTEDALPSRYSKFLNR